MKKELMLAILGIIGSIGIAVIVFGAETAPAALKPTPTTVSPITSHSSDYQPEIIPPLTQTPDLTRIPTNAPTNTSVPTRTLVVLPTIVSTSQLLQLPDLTVTGLSEPVCVPEYESTILEFTFYVRNIGRASTRSFGSFDVGVFFILGQRRYSLEEWETQFDGVIGTSNMVVSNLNPNDDIKFTVVIDLIGNKDFGIEVVANSGEIPIREADMTNNTLLKYFSGYCY